jgi:hypothetical protein
LLAQGANAASIALIAFILLLLLGTQILNWQIVAAVSLLALAAGVFRVRKRLPSPYHVAQLVDRRLELADTISTALYFSEVAPEAPVPGDVRQAQFASAGRLAGTVDVRLAVPYVMPRALYAMVALLVVATSLFALRYGLSRKLDLKQPLANFLPESLSAAKTVRQANNARRNPKQIPQTPDEDLGSEDQDQKGAGPEDAQQDMQTAGDPETKTDPKATPKAAPGQKMPEPGDNQMASDDEDTQADNNGGKPGDENQNGQQGDKSGQSDKQQNGKQDSTGNNENSSLMSKMKDAFQNLMSKMKPQQNQQGAPQQGSQEQNSRQGKAQQGQKGQNKEGQQSGNQQGDAQEGEEGQEAKNSDNAQQGKGQGKSDSQQASKQPGSGIGSQDGDKAIKNAEQLAAMGKISEILGKRSATISGEATVEVQSTSQQLHTPYAQKGAQHTQGGAEISRDEVPVALQPYVQQYFEQLRKQPASPQAPQPPTPIK